MRIGWLLTLLVLPSASFASVYISEVAWMGSEDSANHEWIELYNSGSAVAVDGWRLHDANSLDIELVGTISAGGRVVLERTSDASAPGSAFLLYTGALGNAGATLVLRNGDGDVVNQVAGGEDWANVGGDNTTKETAQLSGSKWITAVATPGDPPGDVVIIESDEEKENVSNSEQPESKTSKNGNAAVQLVLPDVSLQLGIDAPNTVHVGQPFDLSVEPSGVGKTISDSLVYQWSLGNGEMRQGKEVEYIFHHPGKYVVVVSGEYKRQKQFARQTITVLPVELVLSKTKDGQSYVLTNQGTNEIDVGGYRLVGNREHVFPKHTIILPQNEIVIPIQVTNRRLSVVALYDQAGESVAMHIPGYQKSEKSQFAGLALPIPVAQIAPRSQTPVPPTIAISNFGFAGDKIHTELAPKKEVSTAASVVPPSIEKQTAAAAVPDSPLSESWPTFALISLLILGTVGIYLLPHKKDDPPWV